MNRIPTSSLCKEGMLISERFQSSLELIPSATENRLTLAHPNLSRGYAAHYSDEEWRYLSMILGWYFGGFGFVL